MMITERNIYRREDDSGHTVVFVYEDGTRASVDLSDANSYGLGEDELIQKAERLLDNIDASGVRGHMPPYNAGESHRSLDPSDKGDTSVNISTPPDRPDGPVPPQNPLVEEQGEDANIVGLAGEGIIEPRDK